MSFDEIRVLLETKFGNDLIISEDRTGLQPSLTIQPDNLVAVCLELRDNPATYFDFLACLSGVDYGVEEGKFGVVYHLNSIPYKTQLVLKVSQSFDRNIDHGLPSFKSVTSVWRTADWHERECYDLLGIFFEGHDDLRRILLPDDWEGYPLRKDYKTAEYYKEIKIDN